MSTSFFEARADRTRGFTLPELVAIILLIGILSAVALPKLAGMMSFRSAAWRDQVVGALRLAHKSAISHRRLVCVNIDAQSVSLSIASAHPATACNAPFPGIDGKAEAAVNSGTAATTLTPPGVLYFQPSGRVTIDGAGGQALVRTIAIAGMADIVLVGETGHVE